MPPSEWYPNVDKDSFQEQELMRLDAIGALLEELLYLIRPSDEQPKSKLHGRSSMRSLTKD